MTKRQYARRLKRMLENAKDNCDQCPANENFLIYGAPHESSDKCRMCRTFIGLQPFSRGSNHCPCHVLGKKRATERAWKYIRAYEKEEGIVL